MNRVDREEGPRGQATGLVLREIVQSDIPDLFRIRVAVKENAMSPAELLEADITPGTTAERLRTYCKGWIAEWGEDPVGFSIADSDTSSIWALFVYEAYQGRGIGRALLARAAEWLRSVGKEEVWLTTTPGTRADGFYEHLGWKRGEVEGDEVRYTLLM